MALDLYPIYYQMPYFSLLADDWLYETNVGAFLFDSSSGGSTLGQELDNLAWLNYNNKDYNLLGNSADVATASGSGLVLCGPTSLGIGVVNVSVTDAGKVLNYWYGSSDYSMFGVYKLGDGSVWGDAHYINEPQYNQRHDPHHQYNSIKLLLAAGVSADVTLYGRAPFLPLLYNTTGSGDPYLAYPYPVQGTA